MGEYLGFWSFPIFTLNQAFIKIIWENQVLKFFRWTLEEKHILNQYNYSEPPELNFRDIPSLSACKYHSVSLLNSSNYL